LIIKIISVIFLTVLTISHFFNFYSEKRTVPKFESYPSRYDSNVLAFSPWHILFIEKMIFTQLYKQFAIFMEPEGSSPLSQKPTDGP
jgi:hypothetical protein